MDQSSGWLSVTAPDSYFIKTIKITIKLSDGYLFIEDSF
jgi:hypothetical protein